MKDRKDSDEDGYADVLEILGGSRPGDATSMPRTPKDTLEAQLKIMGTWIISNRNPKSATSFKPTSRVFSRKVFVSSVLRVLNVYQIDERFCSLEPPDAQNPGSERLEVVVS